MRTPGVVHELGIRAATENLGVAIGKFLIQFAEGRNFGGADESEVFRPEEINLPLAGIIFLGDGFEFLALFEADSCGNAEIRELLAYSCIAFLSP